MITVVVAVADNGVIGFEGQMPWHCPEDLRRFKRLTMGGALVMGRKTFDSIGQPLPGRTSIVLTRDPDWSSPGVYRSSSIIDAVRLAEGLGLPVFVIGGGQVYREALPLADVVELTEIHQRPGGDVTFPALGSCWSETCRDSRDGFSFVRFERSV